MNFAGFRFPSVPIQFASPLNAAQWAVLLGIPVGIIALIS